MANALIAFWIAEGAVIDIALASQVDLPTARCQTSNPTWAR